MDLPDTEEGCTGKEIGVLDTDTDYRLVRAGEGGVEDDLYHDYENLQDCSVYTPCQLYKGKDANGKPFEACIQGPLDPRTGVTKVAPLRARKFARLCNDYGGTISAADFSEF